ncbi:betaine--homocysteine S-methyltransferase 1-like isoform X2 [Mercenaria mercenaria]|uniref:betaine--homocysteine S-methyltransferase 1-like isoform X2 n=1 Tax=Mercenaria mercenaria TaxID=6596 RepID=UPI00234E9602|nr:betaine--homocysteine S-methyltransferase 1-like isoform X2 [Mercenaria mercenaria]
MTEKGLLQRLENGGNVVVAEGYIFEFERKGYLQAGSFVPEVTLEHPELVRLMYEEFVHAGSDVALAFTEQIELAVKYRADYIVAETFAHHGEAMLALECIKKYGKGLPAVVTLFAATGDTFVEGVNVAEGCKLLEDAGAAVVGLNCSRGPETMIPLLKEIRQMCKGPIAALPVTYRTTQEEPTFTALTIPGTKKRAFPLDLCACLRSRQQIAEFAEQCKEIGVQYIGLCCGNSANMTRIVAEKYGRNPPASKYAPAMEKHFIFGDKSKFKSGFTEDLRTHIGGQFD